MSRFLVRLLLIERTNKLPTKSSCISNAFPSVVPFQVYGGIVTTLRGMVMKPGEVLYVYFCRLFWGLTLQKTWQIQKVVMQSHTTDQ